MDRLAPARQAQRSGRAVTLATLLGALLAALVLMLASTPTLAAGLPTGPGLAVVAADRTALRASPREGAAVLAELAQGDLLEVRGRGPDHLHVFNRRHGRAGFVRGDAVRAIALQPGAANELLAAVRPLRQAPGREALGVAFATAYLRAAPAQRIDAEPFDALGAMAERLAERAAMASDGEAAAQVEALAAYGVRFTKLQREGRPHLCYDGDAFRRVLDLRPDPAAQARAMLALTRHDCVDPTLTPQARLALDAWRADLLDLPWPRGYDTLPALVKNRLHMRRAGLWAARAHQFARLNRPVQPAAERALAELATVNQAEFTDEDHAEYAEAAIRVGAVRWAALPLAAASGLAAAGAHGLRLVVRAGDEPGQTCVQLLEAEGREAASASPAGAAGPGASVAGAAGSAVAPARAADARGPRLLAERCAFATVWPRSVAVRPAGDALVLAVQPLDGWTELWVFRAEPGARTVVREGAGAWRVDVLPPAPAHAGLGYVEFAGWVPGARPQLLVAREARTDGRFHRRFEVLSLDSLDAVRHASAPELLVAFGQWSDAQWRQHTVALR